MNKKVQSAKNAEIVKNQAGLMMHLPQNLYKIRKLHKKKQKEFATLLNVSKDQIGRYERGEAEPDSIFIERLSELTGFSEIELTQEPLSEKRILERIARIQQGDHGEHRVQSANGDNISDPRYTEQLALSGAVSLRDFLEVKMQMQALVAGVGSANKKIDEIMSMVVQTSKMDPRLDLILKYAQLIDGRSRTMEAFLEAWIEYETYEISLGDPEKKKEKLQKLNEIFRSVLKGTGENPQNE